jgi:hypothetical protein
VSLLLKCLVHCLICFPFSIAEALLHATSQALFGLSEHHATLTELFAIAASSDSEASVPEGIKRGLEISGSERLRVIRRGHKDLLQHLLLGLDCDTDWDNLPRTIRTFLLNRCYGQPCFATSEQLKWIESRFCNKSLSIEEYVARCNLGANLACQVQSFAATVEAARPLLHPLEPADDPIEERCVEPPSLLSTIEPDRSDTGYLRRAINAVYHALSVGTKFFVISLVADPHFQRELDYMMAGMPGIIRWPVTFFLNGIWIYCKTMQRIILPFFLLNGRKAFQKVRREIQGTTIEVEKHRIVIDSLGGQSTCFFTAFRGGSSQLHQYSGLHNAQPKDMKNLMAINTYADKLLLTEREEYANASLVNLFVYEYAPENRKRRPSRASKLPMERKCIEGELNGQIVRYDKRGYITSGSTIKDNSLVEFKFRYRENAKSDAELLSTDFIMPHASVNVRWSVASLHDPEKFEKSIPHSKVTEVSFIQGQEVYNSKWHYDHKFHPTIETTCNGEVVETPSMIENDLLDILQKPKNCSFANDNPLFSFKWVHTSFIARFLGFNTKWYPESTSRIRTHLWKVWKNGKELDAVTTRWLDELAMRSDKILKPYWIARDWGCLKTAEAYLDSHADAIMARTDIDSETSSWTPIAFKMSDLYHFGQGGDAIINTRTQQTQLQDSDTALHVLAMDTGTWPIESGGVSACRRDMVNNLDSIRWHILAESANDFGMPRFQIEKNVQSLTVLPLWGLDYLTPTHGIFHDCLDVAVQQRSHDTIETDIKQKFIPILTVLVRCARAVDLSMQHITDMSQALVDLNTYFESSRHWSEVWKSDIVKNAWRELWLDEKMENTKPVSDWLDSEKPTLDHLDQALDMWHRYLFIFSIPVPEEIPDVFQASHHFTGAAYGIVCKLKRNCTLHVWDHCISWREVTVFLSSAMSFDPGFVGTSLMSLSRIASVVILHHADVVLPCADFFNPGWEVELGTGEGTLQHRRVFKRKIDPVVNGICNMERFKPIEELKSKRPTVTMLSHVRYVFSQHTRSLQLRTIRFVKDIKNAILAADIIVNEWGFKDYKLDIYGDMEKAPTYSVECQEIIASKGLREHVTLRGLGNPFIVLEDTVSITSEHSTQSTNQ